MTDIGPVELSAIALMKAYTEHKRTQVILEDAISTHLENLIMLTTKLNTSLGEENPNPVTIQNFLSSDWGIE